MLPTPFSASIEMTVDLILCFVNARTLRSPDQGMGPVLTTGGSEDNALNGPRTEAPGQARGVTVPDLSVGGRPSLLVTKTRGLQVGLCPAHAQGPRARGQGALSRFVEGVKGPATSPTDFRSLSCLSPRLFKTSSPFHWETILILQENVSGTAQRTLRHPDPELPTVNASLPLLYLL